MTSSTIRVVVALACVTFVRPAVSRASQDGRTDKIAQSPQASTQPAAQAQDKDEEDDAVLKPAEPDFTLIALPTSLNLPKYKSAVRITHRFRQQIGSNDFAVNFFGVDSGAQIGLEFRFGIVPHGEIGINRTSERTIEFFAQYGLTRQSKRMPVEIAALASTERCSIACGSSDVTGSHWTPAVGLVVTRLIDQHVALYVEPIYLNNTNPLPKQLVDHNDTFMFGVGGRFRILPTVYIVAETAPRAWGYKPGVTHGSLAIEKRAGGHLFQLNFSNSLATTMGQIATANHVTPGPAVNDWHIGFNISRKFY